MGAKGWSVRRAGRGVAVLLTGVVSSVAPLAAQGTGAVPAPGSGPGLGAGSGLESDARSGRGTAPPGRPLTLEDAVAMALRHNRELEGVRLELENAMEQVDEAWGSLYPRVDLATSFVRNLTVPGSFLPRVFIDPDAGPDELVLVRFGTDNLWSLQIHAEQPLFRAAAFIGVGAASRYRALRGEAVRGASQQVVTRTRLAFYQVLLAEEALRLSENAVRRVRQTLEETRSLHRAGLVSDYDVLRLEVELANLEPGLRRSTNAVAAAMRELAIVLGLDTADGLEVEGTLAGLAGLVDGVGGVGGVGGAGVGDRAGGRAGRDEAGARGEASARGEKGATGGLVDGVDLAALDADALVALAVEARSDLRQLELTERLRRAELRLEQSEYLPTVTLFGTYTLDAQHNGAPRLFGGGDALRAYGRRVGVQVSVPLFSGFRRPNRVAQKRVAVKQVEMQRAQLRARVEHEVRTLLEEVREAEARAAAQRLAVRQAERGFAIASSKYREGLGSQLEVTDAEVALRQSEFNLVEALYDVLVARARLDEAVGRVPMVDTND